MKDKQEEQKQPRQKQGQPRQKPGQSRQRKPQAGHTSAVRLKNWQETYASVEDIQAFLDDHVMLRHNVVTGRTEIHLCTDFGDDVQAPTEWQPVTDRIENSLWVAMSRVQPVRIQDMQRVIASDFVPEYHPMRFYLGRLPPWNEDRPNYIMELSLSVSVRGDADEQILFYEYLRKWLVAMVASWADDRVVNNTMLVLIGEQGAYKTTWFAHLLPPELRAYFYTKTNSGLVSKDDLLTLAQYGLMCWEELDTMRLKELNKLKAAMTMPSINERAAYARHHEPRAHLASFCGTGNNVQFLSDPTGTRRWLPFVVDSIESPLAHPFNHEGIYAQAYALYRQGFRYWFDKSEILRLAGHNEQFQTPSLEQELIDQYFRKPEDKEPAEFLPVSLALQIVGANITQKLSAVALGRAFVAMGYERQCHNHIRGYLVVRRSTDEMRSIRFQLARQGTDGTDESPVF